MLHMLLQAKSNFNPYIIKFTNIIILQPLMLGIKTSLVTLYYHKVTYGKISPA